MFERRTANRERKSWLVQGHVGPGEPSACLSEWNCHRREQSEHGSCLSSPWPWALLSICGMVETQFWLRLTAPSCATSLLLSTPSYCCCCFCFFLTLEVLVHIMQNKTLFSVHFSLFNFINAWTASSKVRAQLVVIWSPFMPTLGFFSPPNPLNPVFLVPVSCSPESPVTLLSFLFSPVGHLWERTYSRGCFCERQTDGP